MNIVSIGSPCSGKTTSAAKLFAYLKEEGRPVELVPEYARLYIAGFHEEGKVLRLTDGDQRRIQATQFEWETVMDRSCRRTGVHVVSDSWSVAALLYMTPAGREWAEVAYKARRAIERADLVCYCKPIPLQGFSVVDPNRVHGYEQSLEIDAQILPLLKTFEAESNTCIKRLLVLEGSPAERLETVLKCL